MGRSLKKGPFVEERLMSRIDAMNAANETFFHERSLFK